MDSVAVPHVLRIQLLLYLVSVFHRPSATVLLLSETDSSHFGMTVFNDYNGAIFTIRARGLNNFVYWTAQIFGSLFMGHVVLDQKRYRRRVRALVGWALVFAMVFVVHTWAYFYQR